MASAGINFSSFKYDPEYFFEYVHFNVESTLFRLPKHAFEDNSSHFKAMFNRELKSTSVSPRPTSPGGNEIARIYHLTDTTLADFRHFVHVLCPRGFGEDNRSFKLTQWLSVLKLATLWKFGEIRALAIRCIDEVLPKALKDGTKLLGISIRYGVEHWFFAALRLLSEKDLLAEKEDVRQAFKEEMGEEIMYKVIRLQGLVEGTASQKGGKISALEVDGLIKKVFPVVGSGSCLKGV